MDKVVKSQPIKIVNHCQPTKLSTKLSTFANQPNFLPGQRVSFPRLPTTCRRGKHWKKYTIVSSAPVWKHRRIWQSSLQTPNSSKPKFCVIAEKIVTNCQIFVSASFYWSVARPTICFHWWWSTISYKIGDRLEKNWYKVQHQQL